MKKYLLITLAFLFIFATVLTSCNVPEDVSKTLSDISEQQSNIPSETESDIPSDIPSQDESNSLTEEDILKDKTVLYYTGVKYSFSDFYLNWIVQGISEENYGGGLMQYIESTEVDEDTYFLVGISSIYDELPPDYEENEKILKDAGMVLVEEHPLLFVPQLSNESSYTDDEKRGIYVKQWKRILPEFDETQYTTHQLSHIPLFRYVGYANVETLRALDSCKDYSIYLTWLNSPDNYEVWENSIHH